MGSIFIVRIQVVVVMMDLLSTVCAVVKLVEIHLVAKHIFRSVLSCPASTLTLLRMFPDGSWIHASSPFLTDCLQPSMVSAACSFWRFFHSPASSRWSFHSLAISGSGCSFTHCSCFFIALAGIARAPSTFGIMIMSIIM